MATCFAYGQVEHTSLSSHHTATISTYLLGWCEIKRLLKSQNHQADYDSMSIPEKLVSTFLVIGCTNFCEICLKELAFLHCKNWREIYKITKILIIFERKVQLI